jgi:hypothetical protein
MSTQTTQTPGTVQGRFDVEGGMLGDASRQWMVRPADQSYLSLEALHEAVKARTNRAQVVPGEYKNLRTEVRDGEIRLVGKSGVSAGFTHWSFGQLCGRVGAPAGFMRELPPTLAGQVLNNRLAEKGEEVGECKLLLDLAKTDPADRGEMPMVTVRALTGPDYARIWDQDITSRLLDLGADGWNPGPETALPGGGKTRGLYASDRDMFALLVDNDRRIFEALPGGGLSRAVIFSNGECGDRKFRMLTCLYAWICGNHNLWGVKEVREVEVRHVGDAAGKAWGAYAVALKEWEERSAAEDEARIKRMREYRLAADKDALLDLLFAKVKLPKGTLQAGVERAELHEGWYGDPLSAWGVGNGLTEVAREEQWQDRRVEVERAARGVFEMAGGF